MSVKNSNLRKQKRRQVAFKNFRILSKKDWMHANNIPIPALGETLGDILAYGNYLIAKAQELDSLRKSLGIRKG